MSSTIYWVCFATVLVLAAVYWFTGSREAVEAPAAPAAAGAIVHSSAAESPADGSQGEDTGVVRQAPVGEDAVISVPQVSWEQITMNLETALRGESYPIFLFENGVVRVVSNSLAFAGLAEGDVIHAMNGMPMSDLANMGPLGSFFGGGEIALDVERAGSRREVRLALDAQF